MVIVDKILTLWDNLLKPKYVVKIMFTASDNYKTFGDLAETKNEFITSSKRFVENLETVLNYDKKIYKSKDRFFIKLTKKEYSTLQMLYKINEPLTTKQNKFISMILNESQDMVIIPWYQMFEEEDDL